MTENLHLTPQRRPEDADAARRPKMLAAALKQDDNPTMTDLSFTIPDSMLRWLEQRAAIDDYIDVGEFVRDLLRREQKAEAEDTAWVRAMIEEGEASGYMEEDARTVLKGIMAKLPDA